MKKWLLRLLKSIEGANKSNFSGNKMDCCDLNKQVKKPQKNIDPQNRRNLK